LIEGDTMEKRDVVRKYLFRNGYTIAVTTDYFDWVWDGAFYRCDSRQDKKATEWLKSHIIDSADRQLRSTNLASERLLHRRISQILLVHFNAFTTTTLGGILQHWREEGVQFVSLDEALTDPIYRFDPRFVSEVGRGFLDQIAGRLGGSVRSNDDNLYSPAQLNEICKASPADPR
jgi:hypothetical protein